VSYPVFVIGVDRSGTTLLSMMLGMHSLLWIPYESHFHVELYNKYHNDPNIGDFDYNNMILKEIFNQKYVLEWHSVRPDIIDVSKCKSLSCIFNEFHLSYAHAQGKKLWGDKTPKYIVHLDVINDLFPNARFVHIVRDGRDVARSLVGMWWGPNDFVSALEYWARRVELGTKMLNMLPSERRMQIRYEDLVTSPQKELVRITEFLGIPFESHMLDYNMKSSSSVGGRIEKHHSNLLLSPQSNLTYKWKRNLSSADQSLAWQIAGSMLQKFGYDSGVENHPLRLFKKIYYLLLRFVKCRFGV
jgi:hypothetical protein